MRDAAQDRRFDKRFEGPRPDLVPELVPELDVDMSSVDPIVHYASVCSPQRLRRGSFASERTDESVE